MTKKRDKKPSGKKLTPFERLARQIHASRQSQAMKANNAIRQNNNLPMGHPNNAHKIESTFRPVELAFAQTEETGYSDVDPKGDALFWDDKDQCYYPMVPAFVSMCDIFDKLAEEYALGIQPLGLRQFAKKIDVGMPLFKADMDAARVTINWMRNVIQGITPCQFTDAADIIVTRALMMSDTDRIAA